MSPSTREAPASAVAVEGVLRSMGDPTRAAGMQRFFKTGPGEYGEGDRFIGLTLPQIRAQVRLLRALPLDDTEKLLESPWHETRMLAVALMVDRYPRADAQARRAIYELYLRRTDRINNWDLVDISAPGVVGMHLVDRSRAPLRRLARSRSVWERRIAIVSTFAFIRRGELDDTLAIATQLLGDQHDLIHKAVGWALREVGKRDERVLRTFLDRHAPDMPRTALRYAIERLSPTLRAQYMAVRPRSARGRVRQTAR
ncbi:MAG TPA: DNA alkylation repair protein [Gemmatimonadaceae bacterium]|nr:DNA alkylation repair protein [Gemmatimonadaceae bacterium]